MMSTEINYSNFISMMKEYKAGLWEDGSTDDRQEKSLLELKYSYRKKVTLPADRKKAKRIKKQKEEALWSDYLSNDSD